MSVKISWRTRSLRLLHGATVTSAILPGDTVSPSTLATQRSGEVFTVSIESVDRLASRHLSDAAPTAPPTVWAFIVGEYPPQQGGVADYTWLLARELIRGGDEVHVYAPPARAPDEPSLVHVHRLRDRYGPRGILQLLALLRRLPPSRQIFVQYTAQTFGMRALNFPLTAVLLGLRKPLWVMFHEFAIVDDKRQSLARRAQALGTRWMAALTARAASEAFVSTAAWSHLVRKAAPRIDVRWLPVPSNVPAQVDRSATFALRNRLGIEPTDLVIGHFGTYRLAATRAFLAAAIAPILEADPSRRFLLVGRHGDVFAQEVRERYPHVASRLIATGGLSPDLVATHLSACDILLQPYADGVTTRRGTVVAGLALGIPTVTTTGDLTETLWSASEAILLARSGDTPHMIELAELLLSDAMLRSRLRDRARALYESRFAVRHTVEALRAARGVRVDRDERVRSRSLARYASR